MFSFLPLLSLAAASILPGRMECPEGYTLLPHNDTCQRYIKSPEVRFPSLGWRLPDSEDELTEDERTCLSSGRIFSPESGTCVSLLSRGPCEAGEWLVLS